MYGWVYISIGEDRTKRRQHGDPHGITKIKDTKYDSITPQSAAAQCLHLSPSQQHKLSQLLNKISVLFSGQLGCYNKTKFTLELKDPTNISVFCKPYPISQTHVDDFKIQIQHLSTNSVLQYI